MPLFAFIGHDGPGASALRKQHRSEHLEGLEGLAAAGRIRHAGPLLDEGGGPIGSVIVFEAESLEAARTLAANDPYVTEGIFERHTVNETKAVFPRGDAPA